VGFVYLILSGTNVRPLHDAIQKSSSGVAPKEIPLPLLEVKHMQEVLLLALKSAAQQEINGGVCVNQLFPDARVPWAEDQMTFEDFGIWEAESRITQETWETALPKLQKRGAFVVNCKGAPFADMIMVPKDGQFAIFIQEKQGEGAKEKQLAGKTVPTFKIGDVRREHDKCNVPFRHLFVLITDKGFDAVDKLAPNELVLPYDQHGAVMGPLLALLRKFNHSNKRKITVQ